MTVESGFDDAPAPDAPHRSGGPHTLRSGMSIVLFAGLASMGAGAVHAAAAGIHAEHRELAQIFIVTAVLQLGVGLWAVLRPTRLAAWAVVFVNVGAVIGWLYTRLGGISWIEGLEVREAPQFADTACAALAVVAVVAGYTGAILPAERRQHRGLLAPAALIGMFAVWTMFAAGTHVHSHGEAGHTHDASTEAGAADGAAAAESADGHVHTADEATTEADDGHVHTADEATTEATDGHVHTTDTATEPTAQPAALAWPRPWDPTQPIDLSGVEGVTAEQQLRATKLVEDTLADLPRFADPAAAIAAGYTSIGDAGTGSEHFINGDLIEDDDLLDPTAPESLVYTVVDGQRTLAGAMYIASARPADDPTLTDWAGPLMTWHKHDNLCWSLDAAGDAHVVGIVDANGNCTAGVRAGGENPMVHVWIQPHPCGVFAALEGIGAGTAAVPESERVDMCSAAHDHGATATTDTSTTATHEHTTVAAKPYDPSLPIDLSGTPGVTPQQQAAAENLLAVTLVDLPQWSDYHTAEAAGFQSIGDGGTGHEHFVQWDWINDDVLLDPDFPESLVYEPQPDGSKKLVSAMYMAPSTMALEDVPNLGGALTQWHIHNNLCYSGYPEHPRVSGITTENGACPAGLVNPPPAPMIHVWIVPQKCGPFAALEGVGAGQIAAGQEQLCDTAHGSG